MKQEQLTWVLLVALAVVSAALVYMFTRDNRPTTETASDSDGVAARAQPAAPVARFTRAAVTADPNGFSNVRGGPSVEHPIVGRVEQRENFTTYPQTGDWWEVRTSDGTTGYMAREWIRMIGDGATVQDEPAPVEVATAIPAESVPPVPARAAARRSDMIIPDSDRRLLDPGEVAGLTLSQLRVARNEIYARRGRAFADPNLRRYFGQFDWYRPIAAEVALNRVETANVALLQAAEAGK